MRLRVTLAALQKKFKSVSVHFSVCSETKENILFSNKLRVVHSFYCITVVHTSTSSSSSSMDEWMTVHIHICFYDVNDSSISSNLNNHQIGIIKITTTFSDFQQFASASASSSTFKAWFSSSS